MSPCKAFDQDYYDKFYRHPRTRVNNKSNADRLARFVSSYLKFLELPVTRILDIGCGLGYWRQALATQYKKAEYTGVEFSSYLCDEYGWEQGSVVDYTADHTFDLVICQGVLQYLNASHAKRAITNLSRLTHCALYLETLTKLDWEENADQEVTDGDVYRREGKWYRREMGRHFHNCGGGLFILKKHPVALFELERAE